MTQFAAVKENRIIPSSENEGFAVPVIPRPEIVDLDVLLSRPISNKTVNTSENSNRRKKSSRPKYNISDKRSTNKDSEVVIPSVLHIENTESDDETESSPESPASLTNSPSFIEITATILPSNEGSLAEGSQHTATELITTQQIGVISGIAVEDMSMKHITGAVDGAHGDAAVVIQSLMNQIAEYRDAFSTMTAEYKRIKQENQQLLILHGYGNNSSRNAKPTADAIDGIGLSEEELKVTGQNFVNKAQLHVIFKQKDESLNCNLREIKTQLERLRQLVLYNQRMYPENNPTYELDEDIQSKSIAKKSKSPPLTRPNMISQSGLRKPPKSAPANSKCTKSVDAVFGMDLVAGVVSESRPRTNHQCLSGRKFALSSVSSNNNRKDLENRLLEDLGFIKQPRPPSGAVKPSEDIIVLPSRPVQAIAAGLVPEKWDGNSKSRVKSKPNSTTNQPLLDLPNAMTQSVALTDSTSAISHSVSKIQSVFSSNSSNHHLEAEIRNFNNHPVKSKANNSKNHAHIANVIQSIDPEQIWNANPKSNLTNVYSDITQTLEHLKSRQLSNDLVKNRGIGEHFIDEADVAEHDHSVVSELSEDGSGLSAYFRLPNDKETNQQRFNKNMKLQILRTQGKILDQSAGSKI